MNQAVSRYNDYHTISRSRNARRQSTAISRLMKRCIVIVFFLLITILLYQYLHTQITLTQSQIALCQKTTQNLQNQERDVAQEIESLKHPQRIGQLASALGMFPPRELKNEKFYNVQYAALAKPTADAVKVSSVAESGRFGKRIGTFLAKLVTYYQRAEAKPSKQ